MHLQRDPEKFSNMVTRTIIVSTHILQNRYYASGQITKFLDHCKVGLIFMDESLLLLNIGHI